jgi:hypothetical protein
MEKFEWRKNDLGGVLTIQQVPRIRLTFARGSLEQSYYGRKPKSSLDRCSSGMLRYRGRKKIESSLDDSLKQICNDRFARPPLKQACDLFNEGYFCNFLFKVVPNLYLSTIRPA